jgi:creatinine amidohydrolase
MSVMSEVRATDQVVIVPIGSWEQHGAHLPFDTDTVIATAIATNAAARLTTPSIVVPALAYSSSGEHSQFLGTISIGTDATTQVLVELIRSCDWAAGVVLVNGHGGNHDAITNAQRISSHEGRRVLTWSPQTDDPCDTHAGHTETSVMLALAPQKVDMQRAVAGCTRPLSEIIDEMRRGGVKAVSSNGVLGDPTTANADDGRSILERWAADLTRAIEQWLGASS